MSIFEQYLHLIGFRPFKKVAEGKKSNRTYTMVPINEIECGFFSTMVPGRLENIWVKDDKQIHWGLHEANKPPTLVWPRPVERIPVIHKGIGCISISRFDDDHMNRLLKEKTPEEIFKMIESSL